ncbi:MAG: Asp23/Gls24 family envelope stress response protein [Chlamydiae bacterium]|nr:Asp23/Gls24 family envelope stress response protein [Chlamydiota bacterium]
MPQLLQGNDSSTLETIFIKDIDSRVFQAITIKCLSGIEGIALIEGNFIDHLLGREGLGAKGITVEQDPKNQSISIKVELNIAYGISIPEKAEEIQNKLIDQIVRFTGHTVSVVHVIFKSMITEIVAEENEAKESSYQDEF